MRETGLDVEALARTESMFALANGHIGLRANLDEGEPFGVPGTYLNSFYELRPLPHAEAGYGYPESGQTLVNVTNGKIIRLLVDDEPFDIRYGELLSHERVLDFRAGVLRRSGRVGLTGRCRSSRANRRASCRSSSVRRQRSSSRSSRLMARFASSPNRSSSPMSRCRRPRPTRAPPRFSIRRSAPRSTRISTPVWFSSTRRSEAGCASRPPWTTLSMGRTGPRPGRRAPPTLGGSRSLQTWPPASACAS